MAKLHELTDAWDDNSDNTSLWTDTPGTGTVQEQNSQLEIIPPASGSNVTAERTSATTYDLTGSYGYCRINATGGGQVDRQTLFGVQIDTSNQLRWKFENGNLNSQKRVGGGAFTTVGTTLVFDFASHDWLAIYESGGTTYWAYSGDGVTWTVHHSEANPLTVTALTARLAAFESTTGAAPPVSAFRDFNTGATNPPMTPASTSSLLRQLNHYGG